MTDNLVYTSQTPKPSHTLSSNLLVRVAAEFVGTAVITFAIYVLSSWGTMINSNSSLIMVAVGTMLAYGIASATFGRASGGHFNPAVSFAGMLTGIVTWLEGLAFIVAQVLGALAAAGVWYVVTPISQNVPRTMWLSITVNGFGDNSPAHTLLGSSSGLSFGITSAIVVELIFTLLVICAFFTTVRPNGSAHKNHAVAVGAAYGLGAMVSYLVDGAGMNPARSTGIAVIASFENMAVKPVSQLWVFWIVPLVAAAVAAFGFIIRDSVQAQRAETQAAVAALRLEQEAAAAADSEDNSSEEGTFDEISEEQLPDVVIETEDNDANRAQE
ncbi:MIP/aquaporin family protein [Alloscardovia omnicolens]|uniref:MIP/aquaporin family protein n=1 Tax=Alloscardovia omnicolens TaxID=419015 RepID=UPI003A73722A